MKRMIRSAEDFSKWIHSTEWTTLPDTNRIEKRVYGKRQMNYAELLKMRVIPEMKVCRACKVELPSDAFNKAPSDKDGLQSMCRECVRKYDAMRKMS